MSSNLIAGSSFRFCFPAATPAEKVRTRKNE
jgi:hypothetical protein